MNWVRGSYFFVPVKYGIKILKPSGENKIEVIIGNETIEGYKEILKPEENLSEEDFKVIYNVFFETFDRFIRRDNKDLYPNNIINIRKEFEKACKKAPPIE